MPHRTPFDLLNLRNSINYLLAFVVISLINRHVIYYFNIVTGIVQGRNGQEGPGHSGHWSWKVVIPVDVMRRAKIEVTLFGMPSADPVPCSRDVVIKPVCSHSSVADSTCAAVLIPGGAKVFWGSYKNCSEKDGSLPTEKC